MRRAMLAVLLALLGCGHEELNFALPDGGHDAAGQGGNAGDALADRATGSSAQGAPAAGASSDLGPAADARPESDGSSPAHENSAGVGAGGDTGTASAADGRLVGGDPAGYPTPPGQAPSWCEQGHTFGEICGSGIDEDCDGMVDEFPGLGSPCATACGEGIYGCNPVTNSLTCSGCSMEVPMACGDGFVSAQEQCDPAASGEQAPVTCTLECERPGFVRCLYASGPEPELCTELQTCNERIGACVPVISPMQPRCPKLRVKGGASNEFYPMIETEDGECWITCSEGDQCPEVLSECYMGFCAVPL